MIWDNLGRPGGNFSPGWNLGKAEGRNHSLSCGRGDGDMNLGAKGSSLFPAGRVDPCWLCSQGNLTSKEMSLPSLFQGQFPPCSGKAAARSEPNSVCCSSCAGSRSLGAVPGIPAAPSQPAATFPSRQGTAGSLTHGSNPLPAPALGRNELQSHSNEDLHGADSGKSWNVELQLRASAVSSRAATGKFQRLAVIFLTWQC